MHPLHISQQIDNRIAWDFLEAWAAGGENEGKERKRERVSFSLHPRPSLLRLWRDASLSVRPSVWFAALSLVAALSFPSLSLPTGGRTTDGRRDGGTDGLALSTTLPLSLRLSALSLSPLQSPDFSSPPLPGLPHRHTVDPSVYHCPLHRRVRHD